MNGIKLTPWQRGVAEATKDVAALSPRRGGKTFAMLVGVLELAMENPGAYIPYFDHYRRFLSGQQQSHLERELEKILEMAELPNGVVVEIYRNRQEVLATYMVPADQPGTWRIM